MAARQKKYNSDNPKYEAVKAYRESHGIKRIPLDVTAEMYDRFKSAVEQRGDKVNAVLREAIEEYIGKYGNKQTGLSSIAQTMQKPQREYEPNSWEAVIPTKYWGKFETLDEFSEYIHENGLEDELSKEMRCMT